MLKGCLWQIVYWVLVVLGTRILLTLTFAQQGGWFCRSTTATTATTSSHSSHSSYPYFSRMRFLLGWQVLCVLVPFSFADDCPHVSSAAWRKDADANVTAAIEKAWTRYSLPEFYPLTEQTLSHVKDILERVKSRLPPDYHLKGHFARIPAIRDWEYYVEAHNLSSANGLQMCDADPEWLMLPTQRLTSYTFNKTAKYHTHDLHRWDLDKSLTFDFAIVSQTFEHLYDPWMAAAMLFDHLEPGGYFYSNHPANNIPHMSPIHFFHFSADCLPLILLAIGFEIVEVGWHGSVDQLRPLMTRGVWTGWQELKKHAPIAASRDFQDCVWVLARKPLSASATTSACVIDRPRLTKTMLHQIFKVPLTPTVNLESAGYTGDGVIVSAVAALQSMVERGVVPTKAYVCGSVGNAVFTQLSNKFPNWFGQASSGSSSCDLFLGLDLLRETIDPYRAVQDAAAQVRLGGLLFLVGPGAIVDPVLGKQKMAYTDSALRSLVARIPSTALLEAGSWSSMEYLQRYLSGKETVVKDPASPPVSIKASVWALAKRTS
eukprot:g19527.t1